MLRPEDTLPVSCQILVPTRSVNSMHMLNTEGQESPRHQRSLRCGKSEVTNSEWHNLARPGFVFFCFNLSWLENNIL